MLYPLALLLAGAACQAIADEARSVEDQCRAIAQRHGVSQENLEAWVKRCVEKTGQMRGEKATGQDTAPAKPKD